VLQFFSRSWPRQGFPIRWNSSSIYWPPFPSVIYGLLGVFIVVPLMREYIQPALKNTLGFLPLFQGPVYGVGLLTAGIVLAIMVIPYIISVSREVLLSVPRDQREAALSLGSTHWESTWKG